MKSAGQVYKSAKTKVYPDGSTNTICCRVPIFKDSDIISSYQVTAARLLDQLSDDRRDKLVTFLHDNDLPFTLVVDLFKHPEKIDVKHYIDYYGINIYDWLDFVKPYYKKPSEPRIRGEPRNDSIKRAKDTIFDFVLCNNFTHFFTGTINPEKFNSTDPKEIIKPVQNWLKDMVKRFGVGYVFVAERHKKGGIHFHGLIKSEKPLSLVDSGTALFKGQKKPISAARARRLGLTDGRTVYNLKSWSFGFSTCIELQGDPLYTAFYVTKYITKDCSKIFGRFFWHSRNLEKPKIIIHDMDFDSIEGADFNGFKYQFKRKEENKNE